MNIQYEGEEIAYSLIQSRRKTIAIFVEPDQKVLVKAPIQASKEEIHRIVEKKAAWIAAKREEIAKYQPKHQELITGRQLWYQGKTYSLQILTEADGERAKQDRQSELSGDKIIVYSNQGQEAEIRQSLMQWYYREAGQWISQRVEYYNNSLKETINRICIKDQKSRWGSCSSKRNLNFNWRIILAPPEVADYVVVHEMCHLRHLNHSAQFWSEVAAILPDYKERRQWLREHGQELMEKI